ncbi:MAG: Uma2 family endonuclease [Bacteroidetes bacterium]|nr:MAG: Uma2 family endonuclease [Bacteroidota bacterium]
MGSSLYYQLLEAPDLKLLLDQVQEALAAEQKKRQEFYDWLTPSVKAEFINGEIVMHSPAKKRHLRANKRLFNLLETYVTLKGSGEVDIEKALVALTRNDYEPDICYWGPDKAATFDEETMRHPAPDLVVEVLSQSTEARDRGIKFRDYAAHGVTEYWIIDPLKQTVEAHTLDLDFMRYETVPPLTIKDELRSTVLAGFVIPVRAIFEVTAYQAALEGLMA